MEPFTRAAALPLKLRASLPAPAALAKRDAIEMLPPGPGAYLLLLRLDRPLAVDIPTSAGAILPVGWYAYAGSAKGPGGLRARIARHLSVDKPVHWHIDRLTPAAGAIFALAYPRGDECALIAVLFDDGAFAVPLSGFGSSDCRQCQSHLLRWTAGATPP